MIQKIKWLYSIVVNGEWAIGFETRKTWQTKPYWDIGSIYYDGTYYYLHVGWFYACVYH